MTADTEDAYIIAQASEPLDEEGRFVNDRIRVRYLNEIIEVEKEETGVLPEGYFWVDYATLNRMVQINNCLNIQLRNLLSLLDI